MSIQTPQASPSPLKPSTRRGNRLTGFFAVYCLSWTATAAALIFVLFCLSAVFAPLIAPQDPYDLTQLNILNDKLAPGSESWDGFHFLLSTDDQGRDLFSGILYGLRISLFVGESGCGKSTLGRIVAGMAQPTSGKVLWDRRALDDLDRKERVCTLLRMQMVFQDPMSSLNPRRKVRDTIGEAVRVHNLAKNGLPEHVAYYLQLVGLDPADVMNRYPHEMSGGQRQRIGIARALAVKPALLICDEAVASLDVSIQAQILNLLMDIRAQSDLGFLFINHDLGVVNHICDRVMVMYLGRIVEEGDCDTIFRNARHPYTRLLLEERPRLASHKARFKPLQGELPSPMDPPKGCHFWTRCPLATDVCRTKAPSLETVGGSHRVAGHHR